MYIKKVQVNNFRLLNDAVLTLDVHSTVIVGRNNSGKTSLTEIFKRFFSDKSPKFHLEDFSLFSLKGFKEAFIDKIAGLEEEAIREKIPEIQLIITIDYTNSIDFGTLSDFIIDLEPKSTEAIIQINYRLKDGKIDSLFEGLTSDNNPEFFKKIKDRIPKFFGTELKAIDPTDESNFAVLDYSKLKNIISADFIFAQRGLDDETQTEKDVLGKVLTNIFKNASNESAHPEMKLKADELEVVVDDIQTKVDTDFKEKVDALLPTLKIFGYPGLFDPTLSTETTLNLQTILESNTRIRYLQKEGISLPETYNGLGSRNLIFILFQLFEYFRKYQGNPIQVINHIIFIEEPEAHLHPQMQEVFIRQLKFIANEFVKTMNNNKPWPVQFIVSTHSTHIANEADFESIRYFMTTSGENSKTSIKDLKEEFSSPDKKEDKEFIHKYLTLTRCDLFFADKAILIEGTTERLLMPVLIKKTDEISSDSKLISQYISVIEIGGAYAHHFYKFLDFLELKTLIISDLDSTAKIINDKKTTYEKCPVSQGTHTSNAGIKNWFKKDEKDEPVDLKEIRAKKESDKIVGSRRIAFQISENGTHACGRSFEDAFILANPNLFDINKDDEEAAYKQAEKIKKTDFALKYAIGETTWNVPLYILEGLIWLSTAPSSISQGENSHA